MLGRLGRSTAFANVCSLLALTIAVGTGGAYAANTVFSTDIVDGEVKTADLGVESVTTSRIYHHTVSADDLHTDSVNATNVIDASLTAADLGFNSVASGEIATDAVNASEVSEGAIDSDEILNNTLTASDLGIGSVGTAELGNGAVSNAKLEDNSVQSSKIANNSITAFDLAGGEANGTINLSAGFVASGRCRDFGISVGGALPGDAVLFSVNTSLPDGIALSGVRVSSADVVVGKACNFTGAPFPQLNGIQVEIVTITI